jgi:hypothetical protein
VAHVSSLLYKGSIMGDDKWAKVIEYLRTSGRDPEKILKLLQGNQKGKETNYDINRSSYSLNVIGVITQKIKDPLNHNKSRSHVIRQWVKSEDFKNFYNLMRHEEDLTWSIDKVEDYVKQINDLWGKPNNQHWVKYFDMTGGYFLTENITGPTKDELERKGVSSHILKLEQDI